MPVYSYRAATKSGKVVSKSKFVKSNNKFILFSCCKED